MSTMAPKTLRFVRVGSVERVRARKGRVGTYVWHDGYSEVGTTFPWMTKREAQADAKARGYRAVFVETLA